MFTPIEKQMYVELLDQLSQMLWANSCNDFPVRVTESNQVALRSFIHDYADGDEDYEEDLVQQLEENDKVYFQDHMILSVLKKRLTS